MIFVKESSDDRDRVEESRSAAVPRMDSLHVPHPGAPRFAVQKRKEIMNDC